MNNHLDPSDATTAPDLVHAPEPFGRRRFIQGVGVTAAAGLVATALPGTARAAGLPAGASKFVALPVAERVLDTRKPADYVFQQLGANYVRVALAGKFGVSANAVAVVATVTAVNHGGGNFVSIVPAGASIPNLIATNKLVSCLNLGFAGEAAANLTQVKIANGGVDLYALNGCDMILDVIGYYEPVADFVKEGRYIALEKAERAIDTRDFRGPVQSFESLFVDITNYVPADASSVVVNLTATQTGGPGFFTVYAATSSDLPKTSSLNVNRANETRAVAVIAPVTTVNGRRAVKVFALNPSHLIVDVSGYFTSPSTAFAQSRGLFVPVDPERILDTRDPGQLGKLWPGWHVEGLVPGAAATQASSIAVNVTGVDSRNPGFLTIYPARSPFPGTSNVNFGSPRMVVPNHAISSITATHGYEVFSSGGAHVLVDYLGYYLGDPALPKIAKPVNPPPPPAPPAWILTVPRIGLNSLVQAGDPEAITDAGRSWHWTGTGYMGQEAHVGIFAHRTEHGGPYRNLNLLSGGDQIFINTGDGREYLYEVVRRDLTDSQTDNILEATRFQPGTTLSLIACSKPDFSATSLSFRIVVTAVLVSWREV